MITEIKRSVFNVRFWCSVFVLSFVLLYEFLYIERYFEIDWNIVTEDRLSLVTTVMALSIFGLIAGMFPGLPYAYSIQNDYSTGFIKYIIIRTKSRKYLRNKILATGISGALSVVLPYVILCGLIFKIGADTTKQNNDMVTETLAWGKIMYIWNGDLVIVLKGVLIMLFGILWSELSLLISLIIKNKYIAYIVPYIIYELLFLIGSGNEILTAINPRYMIRYDLSYELPLWLPFVIFAIYILTVIALIKLFFRRWLKNDVA